MIRFWFKTFFELPQLQGYEYIMRLDDDSELKGKWINVFEEMRNKKAVYFANNLDIDLEKILPGTMVLKNVIFEYVKNNNNITAKQPEMLRDAFTSDSVHNYYNNFEVTNTEFFRRADISHWVQAVDSTHGIFKYRWGDAILRYLTVALFAEQQYVLHRRNYNMSYCHKC
ncbi:unnamed protein product [Adineta steineri]|uniref:Uncharacterized protein n=1 Tax=Adineta steineri TaxID=433720 RepID=A0A815LP63_9BILA|nr:unnamed protein product [Adineta steineri]